MNAISTSLSLLLQLQEVGEEFKFIYAGEEFGKNSIWCIEDCRGKSGIEEWKASLLAFGVEVYVTKFYENEISLKLHLVLLGEGKIETEVERVDSCIEKILRSVEEKVLEFLYHHAQRQYSRFVGMGGLVS